jgi:putative endonuclease
MFFVYILQSEKDKNLYIGFTKDLRRRIQEHNSGLSKSTKPRRPFELIYYEAYKSEQDAKKREESLKLSGRALSGLKRRISSSLES